MPGQHRGWWVKARGAKSTPYKSRSGARSAARNVRGGKVSKSAGGTHRKKWSFCLIWAIAIVGTVLAVPTVGTWLLLHYI